MIKVIIPQETRRCTLAQSQVHSDLDNQKAAKYESGFESVCDSGRNTEGIMPKSTVHLGA